MSSDVSSEQPLRFAVVIVNFNGGRHVVACLDALEGQTRAPDKVLLVDNNSTDGSLDNVRDRFDWVDVLPLSRNIGFAAANNRGFRELSAYDWVVLLNPDTVAEPHWLEKLSAAIRANPGLQVFSSLLLDAANPEILDGSGDVYHVSGLGWRRHHGLRAGDENLLDDPVFTGCAAATAYRRQDLEAVGGFDESYFCYYEDIDLGFRLRLRGARCMVVKDSRVAHVGSGLTGQDSDFSIYHGHRNLVWTYFKNMPAGLLFWYLPQHLLLNLVSLVYYTFKGRAGVIWKAKWDALRGLPRALSKRREVQAGRQAATRDLRSAMVHGLFRPYTGRFR